MQYDVIQRVMQFTFRNTLDRYNGIAPGELDLDVVAVSVQEKMNEFVQTLELEDVIVSVKYEGGDRLTMTLHFESPPNKNTPYTKTIG